MSILNTVSLYTRLFIKTWQSSPATVGLSGRIYRTSVMLLFWPTFLMFELFNGLFLALDYVLFPFFKAVKVRSPLFVVGVPRSGTTFLHRLLAQDKARFTTFTLAELLFAPAISQKLIWRTVGNMDNRLGGWLQKGLHKIDRLLLQGLDDVHQTGLWSPEEDYLGLIPVLGCFLLVLPFPFPEIWKLAYFDRDLSEVEKRRVLVAYERLVQRHLFVHGSGRILLSKNPSFTPMICALRDYFPDAKFIACFRNPTKAVPSQINSILMGARLFHGNANTDYWRDNLSSMLQFYYKHLLNELPQFPSNSWGISVMEDLVNAPKKTVVKLYKTLEITLSEDYVATLKWEERRAQAYSSQHFYNLEQLDIDQQRLLEDFRFVYEHFHYPLPWTPPQELVSLH